jgi:hypothetical protein
MTTIATLLAYALAISILLALIYAAKSVRLQNKFRRLGALEGRSVDEVIKFVGPPAHRSPAGPNREVLEWRRVGFHIALSFSNGACDGVTRVDG